MILLVLRVFLCTIGCTDNPYSPILPRRSALHCAPQSWLGPLIGMRDRLERRVGELDLPVISEVEAHDIDGLPDLVEGDVSRKQGRHLRIEAGDLHAHGDRRRALREFSVGIEVDADVIMAGRDALDRRRFLVRFRLRLRAVGKRDLRRRIAKTVAIERRAAGLARPIKDGLLVRPDEPKVDVGIEGDRPVGGDQKFRLRLDPVDLGLGRRHRDNHDGKNTEQEIGKANPHWRPVDVHFSTYFQQELRALRAGPRVKRGSKPRLLWPHEPKPPRGGQPFLTHMILMNSPVPRLRNGALLARSCWASTPHHSSLDTWPMTATSREKPGSGAQSWGAMPATQIMATMLKVMRSVPVGECFRD